MDRRLAPAAKAVIVLGWGHSGRGPRRGLNRLRG